MHVSAERATFDDEGEQRGSEAIPGPVIECATCGATGNAMGNVDGQWASKPCWACCDDGSTEEDPDYRAYLERQFVGARIGGACQRARDRAGERGQARPTPSGNLPTTGSNTTMAIVALIAISLGALIVAVARRPI